MQFIATSLPQRCFSTLILKKLQLNTQYFLHRFRVTLPPHMYKMTNCIFWGELWPGYTVSSRFLAPVASLQVLFISVDRDHSVQHLVLFISSWSKLFAFDRPTAQTPQASPLVVTVKCAPKPRAKRAPLQICTGCAAKLSGARKKREKPITPVRVISTYDELAATNFQLREQVSTLTKRLLRERCRLPEVIDEDVADIIEDSDSPVDLCTVLSMPSEKVTERILRWSWDLRWLRCWSWGLRGLRCWLCWWGLTLPQIAAQDG